MRKYFTTARNSAGTEGPLRTRVPGVEMLGRSGRLDAKEPGEREAEDIAAEQFAALGFELTLDDANLGEDRVPI